MVAISEADTLSEDDIWSLLSDSFGFPPWFGRNFAALQDLLEDIDGPAELEIVLDERDGDASRHRFFETLARVASRAARENPALQVTIHSV
ncbi:MAG: barstar family protein [Atopobiaceae bacterium]